MKKEDPRSVRSKRLLKEAVFALLVENQDVSQLTVQKITNRAELNRATFYLHYEDINDLLRQIVRDIFDELSMKIDPLLRSPQSNGHEQLVAFLDYIYEYRKIFAVLVEHKGFKTHLSNLLKRTIQARRESQEGDLPPNLVSIDIIAASLLGIIMWWVKDGIQFSSEYVAGQISLLYRKE
ncbi:MAG: TetR/AcrR family transcriptional regulator [Lysinibacillus sp.]